MITVDELVATPELGMSYLAGAGGGQRPITWAHTCDQPEPWLWVGPGDLMMTTGAGLPAEPEVQVDWLGRLAATRACGLMIGPKKGTPEVSEPMRLLADELRFPLIDADFELEFASVAHIVIESVLRTERAQVVTIRRLYDAWAQALHTRAGLTERLRIASATLGWRLTVLDQRSGRPLASSADPDGGDDNAVAVNVPGTCPARLLARAERGPVDNPLLLHHLAALIAVELEHRANERTERRDSGAALLADLLDGALPLRALHTELAHRGLAGPLVLACFTTPPGAPIERLQHAGVLRTLFPPLLHRGACLYALLPDDTALIEALRAELGSGASAGVSGPLAASVEVGDAARQARLAREHAGPKGGEVLRYPELSGLLPRGVGEADALVARYLGALLAHDRANGTELVHTLRTFLAGDRAWQATATQLGIHRQTLVYRLRTVAELTGLRPTSTEGTAKFWLALEAAEATGSIAIRSDDN